MKLLEKIALIHKRNRCHAKHCSCMMYLREIDDIGFILIHLLSLSLSLSHTLLGSLIMYLCLYQNFCSKYGSVTHQFVGTTVNTWCHIEY